MCAMTNTSASILSNMSGNQNETSGNNPTYLMLAEIEDILEGDTAVTDVQLTTPIITSPVVTNSVEVFTVDDALLATESGKVCVSNKTGQLTFTLPAEAAGLTFTFVDASATAADDVWITAAGTNTINGGTAGKSFKNTGDVVNASCVVIGTGTGDWVAIPGAIGTWANDNA